MNERSLTALGWNESFAEAFEPYRIEGFSPARVAIQHRTYYVLYTEHGELKGEVTGKMQYLAHGPQDLPAVGDWVVIHPRPEEKAATILEVLPRKSKFSRQAAGERNEEQIVASNVDVVFLVSGLDGNYNLRRLERYLVLARESGARPVIVLNKADVCTDLKKKIKEVESVAGAVPILAMSAVQAGGSDALNSFLKPGTTGALLGSSGVGKSTIINHLLGRDLLKTREVREQDSRGRHTTTHRELVLLPSGGLLIDTPGMRELQLWEGSEGLQNVFSDIEALASQCRFRDCRHQNEPDCAIQAALENGSLDGARYKSYRKLQREIAYQVRKGDEVIARLEKEKVKKASYDLKRGKLKGR